MTTTGRARQGASAHGEQRETPPAPQTREPSSSLESSCAFSGRCCAICATCLSRREDAEDVAQETYLRLVRAAPLERSEVRVRAFMFKVATNLAYDRFRQRRSRGRKTTRSSPRCPTTRRRPSASSRWSRLLRSSSARCSACRRAAGRCSCCASSHELELRGDRGAARRQQTNGRARDADGARRVSTKLQGR